MSLALTDRYCIVGAGSSGLTVAKNFLQAGLACDVLERNDDVGGNWYYGRPGSSVYQSTRLISSKRLSEFTDFPIPDEYPEFLSHQQAFEYLRSYARAFKLYDHIQFNTPIAKIEPELTLARSASERDNANTDAPLASASGLCAAEKAECPLFLVTLASGEIRRYKGVVIANGHNWDPQWPNYPGTFGGTLLHSSQYRTPEVLTGKRVLVIGGGNSGCDIAVEAAQHAAKTFHSLRRGYHYVPKFLYGLPSDVVGERLLRWRFPLWLRRFLIGRAINITLGQPESFGLPKPDHRILETHPIINSQMLYFAGHGMISPKPEVAELLPDGARFADGTREQLDVIVCATGFKITIPFIDERFLNWHDGRPELYLNAFHPRFDNLFVAGLIQPDSGQWGLVDYQAQLIARFVRAQTADAALAERFRRLKSQPQSDLSGGVQYIKSSRHLLEVEHFSYRRRLQKLIAEFG